MRYIANYFLSENAEVFIVYTIWHKIFTWIKYGFTASAITISSLGGIHNMNC